MPQAPVAESQYIAQEASGVSPNANCIGLSGRNRAGADLFKGNFQ